MSAEQALQTIPAWQLHPYLTALIYVVIIMILVLLIISMYLFSPFSKEKPSEVWKILLSDTIPFLVIIGLFSLVLSGVGLDLVSHIVKLNDEQTSKLLQTPVDDIKTTRVDLVGASSEGFSQLNIHGNAFYISGKTSDTTSYRYVTSSSKGYQVNTLSDHYGKINPNDIYIKQTTEGSKPQLVIVKHRFKDKQVRYMLDGYTTYYGEWTTYTFEVPNPKVITSFNFK